MVFDSREENAYILDDIPTKDYLLSVLPKKKVSVFMKRDSQSRKYEWFIVNSRKLGYKDGAQRKQETY